MMGRWGRRRPGSPGLIPGGGCAVGENTERTEAPPEPTPPPGSAPRTARQRRPTGAPPPLPHPLMVSTTAWLVLAVVIVTCAFVISAHTPWLELGDRVNTWF